MVLVAVLVGASLVAVPAVAEPSSAGGTIRDGDMVLDFTVHGGSITSAGPDGPFDHVVEGTARPGETLSIAASAHAIPADPDSVNLPQDASFDVWFDDGGIQARERVTLAPGEGASLSTSYVVPGDAWRISGVAILAQAWVNPYGGGARTLTMHFELEVVEPETTTTTGPSGGSSGTFPWPDPPDEEPCVVPDDYWDPVGGHGSIVRFGDLHGEVNVRPNCADDDAYIFAELSTPLHHDDRIRTLTRSGAILSFSDMSRFVMAEDTTIVLDIANERRSKLGILAGVVWANLQRMYTHGELDIEMGQAVLGTKGTTFVVEETGSASTVWVFEGAVEMRPHAGGVVEVAAGETVEVTEVGAGPVRGFDVDAELARWDDETQRVTRAEMAAAAGRGGGVPVRRVVGAVMVAAAVIGAVVGVRGLRRGRAPEPF